MLSTLNPKHTDLRDGIDPHDDEIRLVARVEEELSKLAHETAGHAGPAPSSPSPRVETPAPSERPAPTIDVTPHPATDTAGLLSPKPADPHNDLRNDPHDFVPISPTLDEQHPAQRDAAPSFNPPPRVAPVFSATRPARPIPPIEATFRPAARADESLNDPFLKGPLTSLSPGHAPEPRDIPGQARETQPPRRSWLRRAVTSFLLALVGVGATYAWQHHGDEARAISERMLAKWAPQVSLPSWLKLPGQSPDQDPALAAQADQPPVQAAVAAAAPAPSQPTTPPSMTLAAAPPAQATPQDASQATAPAATAPAVAALPPEATQQLQAMARDLATLQQTIDQLKAGQDQMAREIAKLSDQDARRRVAAPPPPSPPRPVPSATRTRPVAAMPPPPPISARRSYPAQPPSVTQQSAAPQAISPQVASPRVMPPPLRPDDPDNAATAPRPPRSLQPQNSDD